MFYITVKNESHGYGTIGDARRATKARKTGRIPPRPVTITVIESPTPEQECAALLASGYDVDTAATSSGEVVVPDHALL